MMLRITKEEMLKRRRIAAGLEPLRSDCSVERTDGIDIDAMLESSMRQAYLKLLDTAPPHLVASTGLMASTELVPGSGNGTLVTLPASCRRAFTVRLSGWELAADVLPSSQAMHVIGRQLNPFTRATPAAPVAVLMPGDEGGAQQKIMAWPAGATAEITAAIDPGDHIYILDEAALQLIID